MITRAASILLAILAMLPLSLRAETPAVPVALVQAPEAPVAVVLPANSVIELEVVDALSSKTSKPGDFFRLKLVAPVMAGEVVLLPAGTPVIGEVIHAAKASFGGKPGELLVSARYIDAPQGRIKLRSSFGEVGANNLNAAITTVIAVGVVGVVVRGSELRLEPGTRLSARLADDTAVTPAF